METQEKPKKSIALNYGLILGIGLILLSVIIYAMGMAYEQDWKTGLISFVITITVIVLGIKKYKEANNGFLSLGQGLKTGMGVALIGAIISIIYTLIFMNIIEPDYLEKSLEIGRQKMLENPNLSEEQIEQGLEMQRKFSSPAIIAAVGLVWSLFLGFIVSLIGSLVMQKKEQY